MKTLTTSTYAILAFIFAIGIVASTLIAENATWNQWRGPNRDGAWPGELPKSLSALELVWQEPLQPSYSGPVTDGKLVYTTETVDESFERMTAYDLRTDEVAWTVRWDGAITVPPYAMANGSWIKSKPALAEDSLVRNENAGHLVNKPSPLSTFRWLKTVGENFDQETC